MAPPDPGRGATARFSLPGITPQSLVRRNFKRRAPVQDERQEEEDGNQDQDLLGERNLPPIHDLRKPRRKKDRVSGPSRIPVSEFVSDESLAATTTDGARIAGQPSMGQKDQSQDRDSARDANTGVPDYLLPPGGASGKRLHFVLCGINPGLQSAQDQHHYAHRTNHFYTCLHQSGMTYRKLHPSEDRHLPSLPDLAWGEFRIGLTNLCPRPTKEMSQLSSTERRAGALALVRKLQDPSQAAPSPLIGFVGKGIALDVARALDPSHTGRSTTPRQSVRVRIPRRTPLAWHPTTPAARGYGLMQQCAPPQTLLFALPSTSARVTSMQLPGKVDWFRHLVHLARFLAVSAVDSSCSSVSCTKGKEEREEHLATNADLRVNHEACSDNEDHNTENEDLVEVELFLLDA